MERQRHKHPETRPTKEKTEEDDKMWPYREYVEVAKRGTPEGTVSILHFMTALKPEKVPSCVAGRCFFELDKRGRGYINPDAFAKDAPIVIHCTCGISMEKAKDFAKKAVELASLN